MSVESDVYKLPSVQKAGELPFLDQDQTSKARRYAGVTPRNTEAEKLWFGKVFTAVGEYSDPHHHGEAETGGYVMQGRAFLRFGERFENIIYAEEGDFIFVPPYMPHIEGNASRTQELIWLTARQPDNIVVNLTDQDIADIEIDYRD
ncbi:MAG TPA: cupin domain-containing protein [Marmoricola sp.]|jgi:uncharacterized RmlC-like cupin family protein|nr:cupin domain-containing protein [Marmoricola sp.]